MTACTIHWIGVHTMSRLRGHGVEFHHKALQSSDDPIAFLDGFGWVHGSLPDVNVRILLPQSHLFDRAAADADEIIRETKEAVAVFLSDREFQRHGDVTERVFAWFNA